MKLYVWYYIWLADSWKIGEYDTICMRLYILPIGRTVPYLIYHREFQYFSRIPFLKSLLAHKEFNNIDQLENGFENCRISKWNNLCVCFSTKPELKHQTLSKSYNWRVPWTASPFLEIQDTYFNQPNMPYSCVRSDALSRTMQCRFRTLSFSMKEAQKRQNLSLLCVVCRCREGFLSECPISWIGKKMAL